MKLLIWAAILLVVVMWLVRAKKETKGANRTTDASMSGTPDKKPDAETMVQCAHCGVHLPASEALPGTSDTVYCSQEHRLRHSGSR